MLFAVHLQFDFSLDTGNFFLSQTRRAALQQAADNLTSRMVDDLAAVNPSGNNGYSFVINSPADGQAFTADNRAIPARTVIVYAGARVMESGVLARGGGGNIFNITGSAAFQSTVNERGQAGALSGTDIAPLVCSIVFNTTSTWNYSLDTSGLGPGKYDFVSVAEHELGHALGFEESNPSFARYISGTSFVGPKSMAVHGSAIPLSDDKSHWAEGTTTSATDLSEQTMAPSIRDGERKLFTELDFAGFDDMGWDILPLGVTTGTPPTPVITGSTSFTEGATIQLSGASSTSPAGNVTLYEWDTNYDGTTFTVDATGAELSFTAPDADGPGTRKVALRVTSSFDTTAISSTTLTITNAAPAAGLAVVGGTLIFTNVTDSTPDLAAGLTYKVDIDDDGSFEYVGTSPEYQIPLNFPGQNDRTVRGVVIDKDGATASFTTNITLPRPTVTITPEGGSAQITEGGQANFAVQLSSALPTAVTLLLGLSGAAGLNATLSATVVTIAAGQTSAIVTLSTGSNLHVDGNRVLSVDLLSTDADYLVIGPASAAASLVDDDVAFVQIPDPAKKGKFYGTVKGTAGDDVLTVVKGAKKKLFLALNGTSLAEVPAKLTRLQIYTAGGKDSISLGALKIPLLIVAGDGDDTVIGGGGRDVIIGGDGADSLNGGAGDDLIVAGHVAAEVSEAALTGLLSIWNGKGTPAQRAVTIADGATSIFSTTAVTDSATDILNGAAGNDLIIASDADSNVLPGKKDLKRLR